VWDEGLERSRQALSEIMIYTKYTTNELLAYSKLQLELFEEKYEEAIATLQFAGDLLMEGMFSYYPKVLKQAEIYQMQGNQELASIHFDSARIFLEEAVMSDPTDSRIHSALGIAYAGLGRNEKAISEGELAVEQMPLDKDFYISIYRIEDLAHIYTMTEEYGLAIETLDELLTLPGNVSVNLLKKDPTWRHLWDLPEFKSMLKKHTTQV
jgi:tetratricopeptide (TPR) repeat protein